MEPKLCGFAIQKWRLRRSMTQVDLSEASGVAIATLKKVRVGSNPKEIPNDEREKVGEGVAM